MNNINYNNYYKNHDYSKNEIDYDGYIKYLDVNIGNYLKNLDKNINILEIGSGQGKFANYCLNQGFKNYTGFDLDSEIIKFTKYKFPDYDFSDEDIYKHLKNNIGKYDIIFMSHVFEHFTIEEGKELSKLIYLSLKKGGKWINIMPNANSILAGHSRFNDITHKLLYTPNSFNQILLNSGFQYDNIIHVNSFGYFNFFKKIIFIIVNKIRIFLLKIFGAYHQIYTFEIISIIKK